MSMDGNSDDNRSHSDTEISGSNGPASNSLIHTHYIFLVHGWLGVPKEVSYFERAINEQIDQLKQNNNNSSSNYHEERFRIHCVESNKGKTSDGVAQGGLRVSNEMQEFIQNDLKADTCSIHNDDNNDDDDHENKNKFHVSLSIVGNSLGGLYARYAISCLPQELHFQTSTCKGEEILKKHWLVNLYLNTFITTASPHIGLASNVYYQVPRFMEVSLGRTMRQTGKDLFLIPKGNSQHDQDEEDLIIFQMATDYEKFLQPLSKFKKRVTYVNVFKTDFMVHTSTAGFLSSESTYPHSIQKEQEGEESFIVATSVTEENKHILQSKTPSYDRETNSKKRFATMNLIMSNSLDALGWTKVFVDSRQLSPIKSVPKAWEKSSRLKWKQFMEEKSKKLQVPFKSTTAGTSTRQENMPSNKSCSSSKSLMSGHFHVVGHKSDNSEDEEADTVVVHPPSNSNSNCSEYCTTVESKDLFKFMSNNDRIHIPLGHPLISANSRSAFHGKVNSNGRLIVDRIARVLVEDITIFNCIDDYE
jgi:hypothetical protein